MSETDQASTHPPNADTEVWQISPHLDSSFDYAIIGDYRDAIAYAKEVVESVFDKISIGEQVQITIRLTRGGEG